MLDTSLPQAPCLAEMPHDLWIWLITLTILNLQQPLHRKSYYCSESHGASLVQIKIIAFAEENSKWGIFFKKKTYPWLHVFLGGVLMINPLICTSFYRTKLDLFHKAVMFASFSSCIFIPLFRFACLVLSFSILEAVCSGSLLLIPHNRLFIWKQSCKIRKSCPVGG